MKLVVRRPILHTKFKKDEYHTIEEFVDGSGINFQLMKQVGVLEWFTFGGSSNFMSGYFHRLKTK